MRWPLKHKMKYKLYERDLLLSDEAVGTRWPKNLPPYRQGLVTTRNRQCPSSRFLYSFLSSFFYPSQSTRNRSEKWSSNTSANGDDRKEHEKGPIIVDNGSFSVKAGFWGTLFPLAEIPTNLAEEAPQTPHAGGMFDRGELDKPSPERYIETRRFMENPLALLPPLFLSFFNYKKKERSI